MKAEAMSLFEEEAMKDYNFQKVVKAGAMALLRTGFWIIATVKKLWKQRQSPCLRTRLWKIATLRKVVKAKAMSFLEGEAMIATLRKVVEAEISCFMISNVRALIFKFWADEMFHWAYANNLKVIVLFQEKNPLKYRLLPTHVSLKSLVLTMA